MGVIFMNREKIQAERRGRKRFYGKVSSLNAHIPILNLRRSFGDLCALDILFPICLLY